MVAYAAVYLVSHEKVCLNTLINKCEIFVALHNVVNLCHCTCDYDLRGIHVFFFICVYATLA